MIVLVISEAWKLQTRESLDMLSHVTAHKLVNVLPTVQGGTVEGKGCMDPSDSKSEV